MKKSLNKVQRALDSRKSKSISSNNSSTSTFTSTDSSSSELTNDGPPKDALPKGERPKTSFWPQDMLPLDIPNARILTYGYDADLFSDSRGTGGEIDGFTKHSRSLLVELESETQDDIPIIFCAHDTGGIIVKDVSCIGDIGNKFRVDGFAGLVSFQDQSQPETESCLSKDQGCDLFWNSTSCKQTY